MLRDLLFKARNLFTAVILAACFYSIYAMDAKEVKGDAAPAAGAAGDRIRSSQ